MRFCGHFIQKDDGKYEFRWDIPIVTENLREHFGYLTNEEYTYKKRFKNDDGDVITVVCSDSKYTENFRRSNK